MVASCREVMESDDTTKGNKRVQNNLGNQGGESSSKYAKTNIDQKLLGTINYKQEYRDAEKGHSQSVSHNVDMTETTLHGSHGNYTYSHDVSMEDVSKLSDVDKLVEITTKCVSLTSESDSTPVDAKVSNNCINLASDLISSNLNNSTDDSQHSSQCACAMSCSCHGGMYLDGAAFGSPLQSSFFSSHDHKVALDDWNPMSPIHMGDSTITLPSLSNAEPSTANSGEQTTKILDKFLIFTQGSQTYTPHQIGIKRIKPPEKLSGDESNSYVLPDVEYNTHGLEHVDYDTIDKVIDMHGHIIGLALSPDQR